MSLFAEKQGFKRANLGNFELKKKNMSDVFNSVDSFDFLFEII